jgi:hypothetical protein
MTILSPAPQVPSRQVIVKGRAFERFTNIGLDVTAAVLSFGFGTISGRIPASPVFKPGGFFALHLDPTHPLPDVSGAGTVTLSLALVLRDGSSETLTLDMAEADLARATRDIEIDGVTLPVRHIVGAPFEMIAARDPAPVRLLGQVLLDGDPTTPASGLGVTIAALPASTTTDINGRFRIDALPVAETVSIAFSDGTDTVTVSYRPDFLAPVNTGVFSFRPDEE